MNCNVQLPIEEKFKPYIGSEFIIDWVHGFCDCPYVDMFFKDLAMIDPMFDRKNWVLWKNGFRNYSLRYCLDGQASIMVCYNPIGSDEDYPSDYGSDDRHIGALTTMKDYTSGRNRGIFVQISGDGCRKIGDQNFLAVMQLLKNYNYRCSRIDVSCDIYNPKNPIIDLLNSTFLKVQEGIINEGDPIFRARATRKHITGTLEADPFRSTSDLPRYYNWTWGHSSTPFKFRMYDKWLEMKKVSRHASTRDEILSHLPSEFWWRLEYEMHYEKADYLFNMLVIGSKSQDLFLYACKDCFCPVLADPSVGSSNTSRLYPQAEWLVFITFVSELAVQTIHFVQLYVKKQRNLEETQKYTRHMLSCLSRQLVSMRDSPGIQRELLEKGLLKAYHDRDNSDFFWELNINSYDDFKSAVFVSFKQLLSFEEV